MAKIKMGNVLINTLDTSSSLYPRIVFNANNNNYLLKATKAETTDKNVIVLIYNNIKYTILQANQSKFLWQLEFSFSRPTQNTVKFSEITGWTNGTNYPSVDSFYGVNGDNKNRYMEVRWIGYEGNRLHDNVGGIYVPNEIDTDAVKKASICPDGYVAYDDSLGMFTFSGGSASTRIYRINYRNVPFTDGTEV